MTLSRDVCRNCNNGLEEKKEKMTKYFCIIKKDDPTLRFGRIIYEKQDKDPHPCATWRSYGYVDKNNPKGEQSCIGIKMGDCDENAIRPATEDEINLALATIYPILQFLPY